MGEDKSRDKSRHRERGKDDDREDRHKDHPPADGQDSGAPKGSDGGGEISMSIEETNRLREKVGLKPLKEGKVVDGQAAALQAKREEAAKKQADAESKEIAERIKRSQEQRKIQKAYDETKGLGDSDDDDVGGAAAWVNKSRKIEQKKKAEAARQAALTASRFDEQDDIDEDEEDEYSAKDLKGLKVRHKADELLDGQTVVLTLKDQGILDEKGALADGADELENVNLAEEWKRQQARDASKQKKGPDFIDSLDDEPKKGLLTKYDDAEEADAMVLDETGEAVDEKKKKQEQIRKMLEATQQSLQGARKVADEYLTQEELAARTKPKKKIKKKDKKLRKKQAAELAGILEAGAEAAGTDLGSRQSKQDDKAAKQKELMASKDARYDNALSKAQVASEKLREKPKEDQWDEEDDNDLYASLAQARRVALESKKPDFASLAAEVASRRTQDEAPAVQEAATDDSLILNDTAEFCRAIAVVEEEPASQPAPSKGHKDAKVDLGDVEMDEGDEDGPVVEDLDGLRKADEDEDEDKDEADEDAGGIGKEILAGRGLAATLNLLKGTGSLDQHVTLGGRTNDKKKGALLGVWDDKNVPTDKDWNFGFKLDKEDEWGRKLTPKEAFRVFSWKFHGKAPGKMKVEKRIKKAEEELKMKSMAAGDTPLATMERLRDAQRVAHSPYVVVSGNVHAGQTSDHASGYGTEEKVSAGTMTPLLGAQTPMTGDKKVEFMLGISKRKPDSSMPPPAKRSK